MIAFPIDEILQANYYLANRKARYTYPQRETPVVGRKARRMIKQDWQ